MDQDSPFIPHPYNRKINLDNVVSSSIIENS